MTVAEGKPLSFNLPTTHAIAFQGVTLRLGFLATMDRLSLRLQSADQNIHSHNRC